MGILRNREELLPVTCAVLTEEDRKSFFSQLQKRGGSTDRIARLFGATGALVQDWISGQANVPYHALQHLSHEFGIDLPPVRELRRESQPVLQVPVKREMGNFDPRAKPVKEPKPEGRRRKERSAEPRAQRPPKRERAERQQPKRGERSPRGARQERKEPRPQREQKKQRVPQPRKPQKLRRAANGEPGPSSELAYWVGTLLVGARVENGRLVFSAGRSIGHEFAGVWAKLSEILFGKPAETALSEDGLVNESSVDAAPLEAFLGRMVGRAGSPPALPRWVWSNQDWKAACVGGLADAAAHLTDTPSLTIDIPSSLVRAAGKILQSFDLHPRMEDSSISLTGADEVQAYFKNVGTNNPKFRQWAVAQFGEPAVLWVESEYPTPQQLAEAARQIESEPQAVDDSVAEPAGDQPAAASDAPAAPPARPTSRRPKKTLYRGRPGSR